MASFGKFLCFLSLLLVFSSARIQAREGKVFTKFNRYTVERNAKKVSLAPTRSPAPAPAPALAPEAEPAFFKGNENGYGLYGHGSGQLPPEKETATTTTTTTTTTPTTTMNKDENELLNEELDGVTFEQPSYRGSNYNNKGEKLVSTDFETGNQNSNNGYTGNSNNNGYTGNDNNNAENYEENGYSNNYDNNAQEVERQGMSDTRFMEGGKYYHDVNNEKYHPTNQYEPESKASRQNQNSNNGYTGNYDNNGYPENYNNNGYTGSSNNNGYAGNYNNNGYTGNSNNNGYAGNYNNNGNSNENGYAGKYYNLASTSQETETGNYNNAENYETSNENEGNGQETQRQGMSDTRFMEGGKYYYDVKNENYYPANGYEAGSKVSAQNQGYHQNQEQPYEESEEENLP